ncbi:MAG: phosphatidate cytidylyltransferase, partial [Thermomicrobium sp.]|nr:phosphatidate cytidylyltransferase [Thermomicrobium sp.]
MRQRTLSATIVLLVTVVPLLLGIYGWLALVCLLLIVGARELAQGLGRLTGNGLSSAGIAIAGSAPIVTVALSPHPASLLAATTATVLIPLAWFVRHHELRVGLERAIVTAFGAAYLGIPLAASVALRNLEGRSAADWLVAVTALTGGQERSLGLAWIAWVLAVTWLTDVSAYLVGSQLGRRKLAPRISPGKTWEGASAGVVTGLLVGLLAGRLFGLPLTIASSALLGAVLSILGELGDLAESYLKLSLIHI